MVAAALLSGCGGSAPAAETPASDSNEAEPAAIPIAEEPDPEPPSARPASPRREIAEPEPELDSDCCRGRNDCKGLGSCAVAGANDCRGKNECKGLGGCRAHCPN